MKKTNPDGMGHFGVYGGRYVAETLMPVLKEVEAAYEEARQDPAFEAEFRRLLSEYVGRPSPLYPADRLTESWGGARIYLKREEECLAGCCGAPMAVINGHYKEKLDIEKLDAILDGLE